MIRCKNAEIINKGKLKLGDTALADSYVSQGRLANASINISVAKSGPTSLPSNQPALGFFLITWDVEFCGIKDPSVARIAPAGNGAVAQP